MYMKASAGYNLVFYTTNDISCLQMWAVALLVDISVAFGPARFYRNQLPFNGVGGKGDIQ